jgi:hypothetical protein
MGRLLALLHNPSHFASGLCGAVAFPHTLLNVCEQQKGEKGVERDSQLVPGAADLRKGQALPSSAERADHLWGNLRPVLCRAAATVRAFPKVVAVFMSTVTMCFLLTVS